MPSQIDKLRLLACKNPKNIILPEGAEPRVIDAAKIISREGIANIRLIDPKKYIVPGELIGLFYDLRKHKGISRDEAKDIVTKDPVYFAALLVRTGAADGFVAGASHTTTDVARASLYCLGLDRKIGVMSSSFVIEMEGSPYGDQGIFVFGDCGIVPDPTPERLAGIAMSSSRLFETLFKREARVALLSYSTKGSAKGDSCKKVLKALDILKMKCPKLKCDGELQLDAAIVPDVAKIKAEKSAVAGRANVLIFPNLDAGNIAYKLVQRLGGARVVGPLLEGLEKPASDLSRGCSVEEIVDAVAATVIRAQQMSFPRKRESR